MKVTNMTSSRGNTVPNQFIITDTELQLAYFQSYNTIVIKRNFNTGTITIDTGYPFSKTTSKYASQFLGEDSKTIKRKIADGTYITAELNK